MTSIPHAKNKMIKVIFDYINEHVCPDIGEYIRWGEDHRHRRWLEFKAEHIDEQVINDLVLQILDEIARQLNYVDGLDPWVNEDALIKTLNTFQGLSNEVLEQGATAWLHANRVDLVEAFEEDFIDGFDGEFDDLSDEQRMGELRASLAEATRVMIHFTGSKDVAALHLVRAWVVTQTIESEAFKNITHTRYIQPALDAWFEKTQGAPQ